MLADERCNVNYIDNISIFTSEKSSRSILPQLTRISFEIGGEFYHAVKKHENVFDFAFVHNIWLDIKTDQEHQFSNFFGPFYVSSCENHGKEKLVDCDSIRMLRFRE